MKAVDQLYLRAKSFLRLKKKNKLLPQRYLEADKKSSSNKQEVTVKKRAAGIWRTTKKVFRANRPES